jgi:hypothetical protein
MRHSFLGLAALIGGVCAFPAAGLAEAYICAITEVFECEDVKGCTEVSTNTINLAELVVLDPDKKTMTGVSLNETAQSEDIEGVTVTDKHIFLYGHQDVESWNATISLANGALTGGISSDTSAFALFGHCTKK